MSLIAGGKDEVKRFLQRNDPGAYVYILRRPDNTPFYVGKGGGGPTARYRIFAHEAEAARNHGDGESNPFKCNTIRKIMRDGGAVIYEIESSFKGDEEAACRREAELIARYRPFHAGGCLTNLSSAVGNAFGLSRHSRERHAETLGGAPQSNPDRAVLNQYLAGIGPVASVPIKPIGQLKPVRHSSPHPGARRVTPRQCYALVASAAAHGLSFSQEVRIPRKFVFRGVTGIIENGAARDILKAGLATLVPAEDPREEIFALDRRQTELLVQTYGEDALRQRDLL